MTLVCVVLAMSLVASMPSICGIWISISATVGFSSRTISRPAWPFEAVPMTWMCGSVSKINFNEERIKG